MPPFAETIPRILGELLRLSVFRRVCCRENRLRRFDPAVQEAVVRRSLDQHRQAPYRRQRRVGGHFCQAFHHHEIGIDHSRALNGLRQLRQSPSARVEFP